jgi:hypothetical protein
MWALIVLFVLALAGCGTTGDLLSSSATGTGDSSPNGGPVVTPGGDLGPPPSGAPANSYTTTTGGYITFTAIVESSVDASESLVGAALMGARPIVLFRRSQGSGVYFWDVFELGAQNQFRQDCAIPQPIGSSGTFLGLAYDGTSLVVLNSNNNGLSLYRLNPDACTTSFGQTLNPTPAYGSVPFAFFGGLYFTETTNQLLTINPATRLVNIFNYVADSWSGASPDPDVANFTLGPSGATWFTSSNYFLWSGEEAGSFTGWVPLPLITYTDLTSVHNILAGPNGQLILLTMKSSVGSSVLRLYEIDASRF